MSVRMKRWATVAKKRMRRMVRDPVPRSSPEELQQETLTVLAQYPMYLDDAARKLRCSNLAKKHARARLNHRNYTDTKQVAEPDAKLVADLKRRSAKSLKDLLAQIGLEQEIENVLKNNKTAHEIVTGRKGQRETIAGDIFLPKRSPIRSTYCTGTVGKGGDAAKTAAGGTAPSPGKVTAAKSDKTGADNALGSPSAAAPPPKAASPTPTPDAADEDEDAGEDDEAEMLSLSSMTIEDIEEIVKQLRTDRPELAVMPKTKNTPWAPVSTLSQRQYFDHETPVANYKDFVYTVQQACNTLKTLETSEPSPIETKTPTGRTRIDKQEGRTIFETRLIVRTYAPTDLPTLQRTKFCSYTETAKNLVKPQSKLSQRKK